MQGSKEDPSILLVDDERDIRDIIERSLGEAGYSDVRQAGSVQEAREQIAQHGPFALLVLDILMPGEPGTVLLHELASEAPETVIVVATAVSEIETAVHALKEGAYDYLLKPLMPEAVQLAVGRALRRRMLELESRQRRRQVEQLARERSETLQTTRHALLEALCEMAEFRHAETGAHLRRVPAYACILASDMAQNSSRGTNIDGAFIHQLEESAPLHDIGKVAVPDRVLLKEGPLTDEEYEEAKLHAPYGRDICLSVKEKIGETESGFIDMAIDVTAAHHERWDGTGYPEGLGGSDIPLAGHIVHMADLYDACRSSRVYRPEPIPRDELLQLIEQERGRAFCPDLVDSFFRSLDSITEVEDKIVDFL